MVFVLNINETKCYKFPLSVRRLFSPKVQIYIQLSILLARELCKPLTNRGTRHCTL